MQKWRKKMGITIDTAITWLNTDDYESKGFADATSVAIDIMRKYQKIEQIIMDDWDKGYQHSETLNRIKEVIENGNNDL